MNAINDPSVQRMAAISLAAVTLAESNDFDASLAATSLQNTGTKRRTFRPSSQEEESWVSFYIPASAPNPDSIFNSNSRVDL